MSSSCCSISSSAAAGMSISEVHPDIIQTHILTRLDGPTLASASCASSRLHDLCVEESLWKQICNINWPATADPSVQRIISAFPAGHRSFYSDSFPTLPHPKQQQAQRSRAKSEKMISRVETSELVSAVDIHYGDQLLYSKVVTTECSSGWFMCSPFRIDLLDPKEIVPTSVKLEVEEEENTMKSVEENMRLSWILIDPVMKRAVNMSSTTPVEVRRHWLTGDIQVRYSTVMASTTTDGTSAGSTGEFVNCKIMVTCGAGKEGGDLQVKEVSVQVEDMEGKIIGGKDSLVILREGMDGKRRKVEVGEEKSMYEMFLESKREWKERKQSRERKLDMVCIATGVTIFLAFLILVLFR